MKNVTPQFKDLLKKFIDEKHDRQLIIIFSLLVFCLCLINFTSWRYAYYSDEWEFFVTAKHIAKGIYAPHVFDLNGVFGTNPVLGSYYQALFLKILGPSIAAWKLSSIILVIPILFFFFYWVKSFFNRRIAWLSTFLFGTAHLLINFIKISYPNHLAFLLFIILLWFSQRIKTHSTYLNFGILGFVFGLAFYIFIGPLFPLMLLPVMVQLFIPRDKTHLGSSLKKITVTAGAYGLIVLPSLLVTDSSHWQAMYTLFNRGASTPYRQVISNVLGKFYLFILQFEPIHIHFSGGRIVSPLAASLVLLGMIVIMRQVKQQPNNMVLLLLYGTACVTIGISDRNEFIGITRVFFLLPFLMVFAAIGANQINNWIKHFGTVLVISAALLSFYFAFITYPMQAQQHVFSQILRENSKGTITYVYPYDIDARISILDQLLDAYGYAQNTEIIVNSEFDPCLTDSEKTIIFLAGDTYTQQKIEQSTCELNKLPVRLEHYYYN